MSFTSFTFLPTSFTPSFTSFTHWPRMQHYLHKRTYTHTQTHTYIIHTCPYPRSLTKYQVIRQAMLAAVSVSGTGD